MVSTLSSENEAPASQDTTVFVGAHEVGRDQLHLLRDKPNVIRGSKSGQQAPSRLMLDLVHAPPVKMDLGKEKVIHEKHRLDR